MIVNLIALLYLFCSTLGLCQGVAESVTSDGPTPAPKFITRGHLYKAVIGDTIVNMLIHLPTSLELLEPFLFHFQILPCKVKDLG